MEVRDVVEKLEQSQEYLEWKGKNKESFLADAFLVIDTKNDPNWQLGYYTKGDDKVTVFRVGEKIEVGGPEELLKKEEDKIHEVKIEDVEVDMDEAFRKSVEFLRVKYPKDTALKTIMILQNVKEVLLWNVTHISAAYNAINVRIDAGNGTVISHTSIPLFEFTQKEKDL